MRAIAIESYGDTDCLRQMAIPRPKPGRGEMLLKVVSAGVSPVDALIRSGALADHIPATFPLIPGWDAAGVVEEFGPVDGEAIERITSATAAYRKLSRQDFVNKKPLGTLDTTADLDEQMSVLRGELDDLRILYAAAVREADRCVGEMLEQLERTGRYEDSIIILIADHGEEMDEHGGWQHDQSVYEELVHVPVLLFPVPDLTLADQALVRVQRIVLLLSLEADSTLIDPHLHQVDVALPLRPEHRRAREQLALKHLVELLRSLGPRPELGVAL